MPGRKFDHSSLIYRYGFNGKENDNEVKGEGNHQDYGMRIYDPRLGRFLSVDPLTTNVPFYSPYLFAGDKPIVAIDKNGEVEIIIHHKIYSKDGKTLLRQYTNRFIVETIEDIRGITREPVNVEVIHRMTTVAYQLGGGSEAYYDIAEVQFAKIVGGGESYEDKMWAGWDGKMSKLVYKTLKKFWPAAKLNDAFANNDRDPVNNEFRSPTQKYLQAAEAIIEAATLGRSWSNDAFKKLGQSQLKKIIDWGTYKTANEKLGLDQEKSTILGYYLNKFAFDGATGKIKTLFKLVESMVKVGTKGAEAVGELKRIGVNLETPKGVPGAVDEALKFEGSQNLDTNGQRR